MLLDVARATICRGERAPALCETMRAEWISTARASIAARLC
jgi:hypothetical protein